MTLPVPIRRRLLVAAAVLGLGTLGWAAFAPIHYPSRDEIFEIPRGTWKRRMSGDKVEILPSKIRLALKIKDVLVLRNLDDVPQIFGPTLIMPGQSFRLPFEVASENEFMCTAHAKGQMTVIVDDEPTSPAARVRWRLNMLTKTVESSAPYLHAKQLLHVSNS